MTSRVILILLAMVTISVPSTAGATGCRLRAAWDENPPISMRDADGMITGLSVDIVQAMGKRCDCEIEWLEMPWPRALSALARGRVDLLPGAALTPERENIAVPLGPYGPARRIGIIARADAQGRSIVPNTVPTLLSASDARIGIVQGAIYGPAFTPVRQSLLANGRLEQARTFDQLYQMLRVGNVDGVVVDMDYFDRHVRGSQVLGNVVDSGINLGQLRGYVLLSKASAAARWSADLNVGLQSLDADGSIAAISSRWLQ